MRTTEINSMAMGFQIEGLLMRLVIFVNTSFHLNSLNITVSVSVCYVSGSKVNGKDRGTQREYSSKPPKHSIVTRILVFKR